VREGRKGGGEKKRKEKGEERKRKEGKRKRKKEKKKRGKKEKKGKEKGRKIEKRFWENSKKLLGKFGKGFAGFSGRQRIFRDSGDGEADRSPGQRRARDSRPVADRDVGKARRGAAGVRCRREMRHACRGERERESSG
jgi:hypothetical protein